MPFWKSLKLKVQNSKFWYISIFCFLSFLFLFPIPLKAETTPPITTHEFSGTLGNNGWYTSTVDVTLRTKDLESGPKSTTYWLDSNSPTTINYSSSQNQILNPSFEESDRYGEWPDYWYAIRHWGNNDCEGCNVLFWQSAFPAKFGWRSAAVGILGAGQYYYHNRDRSVSVNGGEIYTISVWVKTLDIAGDSGAWLEVWSQGSGDWDTDQKIGETSKISGTNDWTLLTHQFTAPVESNQIYVRLVLEDSGFIGVAWWDGVNMFGGADFFTDFLVIQNGIHTLYYYSEDNEGNIESVNEVQLKLDTVGPERWEDFDISPGGNDHSYIGMIHAQDVTSGLDISETYYAYYTDHQDQGWDHNGDGETDWYPVESVKKIPSGDPAPDGITEEVKITTPSIDFGDSATIMKFQLQAKDMAGNVSNSPVLTVAGAWMKSVNQGGVYVQSGINMSAQPVSGQYNNDTIVSIGNNTLVNFFTSTDQVVINYTNNKDGTFLNLFSDYDKIIKGAVSLPGGKLPTTSGIYYYNGNYTMDQNSITAGFESAIQQSVILVNGNLTIKKSYSLAAESRVVFLVTGNIGVEGSVEYISGFFITEGVFNTNVDWSGKKSLQINGGISATQSILLGRDLGRKGNPNNTTTPAEVINFQPKYFFNNTLGSYLGGSQVKMNWQEE